MADPDRKERSPRLEGGGEACAGKPAADKGKASQAVPAGRAGRCCRRPA